MHGTASLTRGRFRVGPARCARDLADAQALRARAFELGGTDRDGFDDRCDHLLVRDAQSGRAVCCFRMMTLPSGEQIDRSYSAQFYDLSALGAFAAPIVEIGRFCVQPSRPDPDILRLAWAALTVHVDASGAGLLIGCTSFRGTRADRYRDAFALLRARHLAPRRWRPRIKAARVYRFAEASNGPPEPSRALQAMPPLLRSYLAMGGWVSDHAVVDAEMNSLHVFTGLPTAAIPALRKRTLRRLARAVDAAAAER